ncbi:hypothetical protein C5167_004171 [Papaver somniferum]|nr:hypothetical protein C5167_004171 [Papaver somniferum]
MTLQKGLIYLNFLCMESWIFIIKYKLSISEFESLLKPEERTILEQNEAPDHLTKISITTTTAGHAEVKLRTIKSTSVGFEMQSDPLELWGSWLSFNKKVRKSTVVVHTIIFMEIASKIANEITVGQRFAAYMVILMRKEGVVLHKKFFWDRCWQILLASNVSRAKSNCLSMGSSKDQVPDIVDGAVAGDTVALHCSLYSYLCEDEVTLIFVHMRRIYKDPWLIFTSYVRVYN